MRRVQKLFLFVVAITMIGISGIIGWLTFSPPDGLLSASAVAAKMVCSNVFIAKRDAASVIGSDVAFALPHVANRLKISVDPANQRVEVAFRGLFAKRDAQYEDGRGCTLVSKDEIPDRAAPPSRPAKPDALWPAGERVQLSEDKRLLAALNDPALQGPGMRAIVVVQDGRIVAETYGEGFSASTPLQGWSMTKTVNAALAGMAIKDGKLSLDRQNLFPQWAGDARADISVADLMAMTSGLKWSEAGDSPDPDGLENLAKDAAAFARDRPLVAPPGTKFNYAGGSSVLLARLWQNAVGADARAYPQERLFKPLGMTSAVLEADPSGTFLGEAFLFANAHDWVRFGEFLRLNGEWNGEQLLPAGFVDYMRSPVLVSEEGHGPVYGRGQLWLGPGQGFRLPADTFMMQGHLRQVIAIIPSRKLVILRMGLTREDIGYSTAKLLQAIAAASQKS
ncbi:beta-lactamase family protein [Bradyrhizobium huanghuaihaiense]|uniref:serine hydrolase domain-containing protein n=1 Tax=Bradyrhizobium huanghuaihaiense TaxID=990078 RepID=UPI0021AA59DF|nr:serine hydrolase [Bradyrhizobium sp. CB3035]UWU76201.1 beta-lactamase family protein [Bradyrhizobium sp. CB3035]UWU80539.1 beta-lactamase family protein [Bradyrhizobium sp. CB3035]